VSLAQFFGCRQSKPGLLCAIFDRKHQKGTRYSFRPFFVYVLEFRGRSDSAILTEYVSRQARISRCANNARPKRAFCLCLVSTSAPAARLSSSFVHETHAFSRDVDCSVDMSSVAFMGSLENFKFSTSHL
jgi:hypothetical protein